MVCHCQMDLSRSRTTERSFRYWSCVWSAHDHGQRQHLHLLRRGDPRKSLSPDCYVAFGVDVESILSFDNYRVWEVGKAPASALEIGSPSTASNDVGPKRDLYASLGVREYWRFDPTGGDHYGERWLASTWWTASTAASRLGASRAVRQGAIARCWTSTCAGEKGVCASRPRGGRLAGELRRDRRPRRIGRGSRGRIESRVGASARRVGSLSFRRSLSESALSLFRHLRGGFPHWGMSCESAVSADDTGGVA